jgi:MFS transporter, FSR family, fosmidomycin resistance protein
MSAEKPFSAEEPSSRPHFKLIAFLAAGHLVVDLNQGALPALLPHLKSSLGLSYAAVGTLLLVSNITSSVIQPLFGLFADRKARQWILPVAILLSACGFALTGPAGNYHSILMLTACMGLGVASYHPEGFKTVNAVGGSRKTTAMSWFSIGGSFGYSLGPLVITALVAGFGVNGTLWMLAPGIAVSSLLMLQLPRLSSRAVALGSQLSEVHGKSRPGGLALLIGIVVLRSWTQLGLVAFVPFYYVDHLKTGQQYIGVLLFLFLGAGVVGNLIAGPLADRWGNRALLIAGFVGSIPLSVLFLLSSGFWSWLVLALLGAFLFSTFSVTVVLGQQYLPRRPGLASGLTSGFAIGAGGVGAAGLGWVADHFGLMPVLWIAALLPVPALIGSFFLPRPEQAL